MSNSSADHYLKITHYPAFIRVQVLSRIQDSDLTQINSHLDLFAQVCSPSLHLIFHAFHVGGRVFHIPHFESSLFFTLEVLWSELSFFHAPMFMVSLHRMFLRHAFFGLCLYLKVLGSRKRIGGKGIRISNLPARLGSIVTNDVVDHLATQSVVMAVKDQQNTPNRKVVYMCFIFYSMQHEIALPLWRHACKFKFVRVGHLGLVFLWEDGDV